MKFRVTRIFLLKLWRATMRNHCPLLITDPPPSSMPSSSPGEQGSRSVPAPPWTAGRLGTGIGPQKIKDFLTVVFKISYMTCMHFQKKIVQKCVQQLVGFCTSIVRIVIFLILKWKISLVLYFFCKWNTTILLLL